MGFQVVYSARDICAGINYSEICMSVKGIPLNIFKTGPEGANLSTKFALKGSIIAVFDGVLLQIPDGIEKFIAAFASTLLVLFKLD